jgi:hypothetical protein
MEVSVADAEDVPPRQWAQEPMEAATRRPPAVVSRVETAYTRARPPAEVPVSLQDPLPPPRRAGLRLVGPEEAFDPWPPLDAEDAQPESPDGVALAREQAHLRDLEREQRGEL